MSQIPGSGPAPQPWGGVPQQDPRLAPGPTTPAPGQGYQPGYGSQPAPAPSGQSGYPGQPGYAQQPGYAPQSGYSAPGYPQQQYPTQPGYGSQPQQYAAVPYRPAPASGPGSPVLGIIAVVVVVLGSLGCLAGGWFMVQEIQRFIAASVYTGSTDSEALQQAITGPIAAIGIAATAGFAGWVAGIVAAATNRGRVPGILAIVVGVLAPVVIGAYIAVSLAATAQLYQ